MSLTAKNSLASYRCGKSFSLRVLRNLLLAFSACAHVKSFSDFDVGDEMRVQIKTIGCYERATSQFVIRRTDGFDVERLDASSLTIDPAPAEILPLVITLDLRICATARSLQWKNLQIALGGQRS
jgi:hypothetical protein